MNLVDWIIIAFIIIALVDGFVRGFIIQTIELLAFGLALVAALFWYRPIADYLMTIAGSSALIAKPAAFLAIWLVVNFSLMLVFKFVYRRLPKILVKSIPNRLAGLVPAVFKSIAYIGLALTILLSLPFSSVKKPIENSRFGQSIVNQTGFLVHALEKSLGGSLAETFNFLTTTDNTESTQTEISPVLASKLSVQAELEEKMLELVNTERQRVGLSPLAADDELRAVARAHSRDMWIRGFFDHVNPDGQDPFDRIRGAGIEFVNAGENLALAPSIEIAHYGLMRSPTHRDNILSPDFGRVGIGVISAGVDGLMVTQDFRD